MNKGIIIALLVGLVVGYLVTSKLSLGQEVGINKITTTSPNDTKEAAFQESQSTSTDNSLGAIEQDLNNTVFMEEDFSDLE